MTPWPPLVVLNGHGVRLEPLAQTHASDLQKASAEGQLHRLWYTSVPEPDDVPSEIDRRLGLRAQGSMLPFAVIEEKPGPLQGRAVGMTTYMNIDAQFRRVEIGSTWYRPAVQRSSLNTACKLLLLGHAFEQLDCLAVEFRTHFMNHQSRRAIERLGAKLDGVLRAHMRMADGSLRDTAVYSVIACEWPAVRANLTWALEKPRG